MISEESCDTQDWSNDAENSALITAIHLILKYFKIENIFLKNNISNYYCFYCIFDQINAALVSRRDFLQKHKKTFTFICGNLLYIIMLLCFLNPLVASKIIINIIVI